MLKIMHKSLSVQSNSYDRNSLCDGIQLHNHFSAKLPQFHLYMQINFLTIFNL